MREKRKIINTNIRLNLLNEPDKKAWKHLQNMDRKKYKSYSKAVVIALNDYFERVNRMETDPYLETREKEDAFLAQITKTIESGAEQAVSLALVRNLLDGLRPYLDQVDAEKKTECTLGKTTEEGRDM